MNFRNVPYEIVSDNFVNVYAEDACYTASLYYMQNRSHITHWARIAVGELAPNGVRFTRTDYERFIAGCDKRGDFCFVD